MPVRETREIIDGQDYFGAPYGEYVRGVMALHARRQGLLLPDLREVAVDAPVQAHIRHGRWMVECDQSDCKTIQLAWLESKRFMCTDCWNRESGGVFRPVAIPEERDRIEAALVVRPKIESRSWLPEETVEDLWRENAEHGVV